MKSCIKFHKFNKYFKYILLTALFRYFNVCFLGYNFNKSFLDVSLPNFINYYFPDLIEYDLGNYRMIEFFFNYVGTLFFSFLTRIYELKVSQERFNSFFKLSDSFAQTQITIGQLIKETDKKDGEINENCLYKFKNYLLKNKSFLIYIIISFVWVVDEILMIELFYQFKDVDFWFFEILIVTMIYSIIFLVQICKHQKFSIALNLIPTFFKIICLILTLKSIKDTVQKDEKEYWVIYNHNRWWIFFGILLHPILTAIISFINCSLKSFLDLKYTTISQLLMFYSSIGIIISFLICIISTFYPCSTKGEETDYISFIMCRVKEDNNYYFDNFNIYFSKFLIVSSTKKIFRIIIIIFDSLSFFFWKYFFLFSIKYTDPVHIYFYIPIYYILQKIILVINNLIMKEGFFLDHKNFAITKYFLDISGDFLCLIGFLIYLEVIELNFCGFNYDLKQNIAQRGIDEHLASFCVVEGENADETDKDFEDSNIEHSSSQND